MCNWSNCSTKAPGATKAWTVPAGDGAKTVYAEQKDAAGNVKSLTSSISLDTTPPTVTGATYGGVYADTVTFSDGTATLNGLPYTSGSPISADGLYTLIVIDAVENTARLSFAIDRTPPVGTLSINSGALLTNQTDVKLNAASGEIGVQARFSNDNATWGDWKSLSPSIPWTLPDGDGLKTVYVQWKNLLGNTTDGSASITLDKTPPTVTGATYGGVTSQPLTFIFTEGTAALNGASYTSGTTINAEGIYALVVTDAAAR
ncbi:hypothetical protein Elgi_74810 [Paenibacillus elgii]|uniref:hypothetical protein n=1 Tax=Paenibacillus elgii TaxID=189691 RepID=UPI002D7BC46F|nr:hypothetical protein Elgi_74810 [Paenibacillus elgii]